MTAWANDIPLVREVVAGPDTLRAGDDVEFVHDEGGALRHRVLGSRLVSINEEHATLQWVTQVVPMLLFCPACSAQHIDAPQPEKNWTNPPHRSHECQACGHVWRPSDVCTTGVASIETQGKRDGSAVPAIVHRDVKPDLSRLRDSLGELLSAEGCSCECEHHHEEHDDDCERCFACRVEATLTEALDAEKGGARG